MFRGGGVVVAMRGLLSGMEGGGARLVEELTHVGLGLTEPHRKQLWALDRDEVGLALVGDGLGEQRLAAAGRAVEQYALGG